MDFCELKRSHFKGNDVGHGIFSPLHNFTITLLSPPAVHTRLLCLVHGHPPHAPLWLGPRLRSGPVPLQPASHLHTGPDPPRHGPAGPPGSPGALCGHAAREGPPRLGEEPAHPLHAAGRRQPQRAGGCQPCVRKRHRKGVK